MPMFVTGSEQTPLLACEDLPRFVRDARPWIVEEIVIPIRSDVTGFD